MQIDHLTTYHGQAGLGSHVSPRSERRPRICNRCAGQRRADDGASLTEILDPVAVMRVVRVIPVVTVRNIEEAAPLARALVAGGLPVIEITLRTPAGLEAISATAMIQGALVGAGTVMTGDQARAAVDAGAKFLVSPGLVEDVVEAGAQSGVPVLPGIATPTEMVRALALGCLTLKVFPASLVGGPALIRALAALRPDVAFVPTGGIDLRSAPAYLEHPQVVAVGGSWMLPTDAVERQDWEEIERQALACATLRAVP